MNKLFTLASFFAAAALFAQGPAAQLLHWETGDVTLLSDLGKVWIHKHSGKVIKDAYIWDLGSASQKLIYKSEGTLHDVPRSEVKKITAGKNSRHRIYPDEQGSARIGYAWGEYNVAMEHTEFPVSLSKEKLLQSDSLYCKVVQIPSDAQLAMPADSNPLPVDTLVTAGGNILAVHFMQIGIMQISYIKAANPRGPLYILRTPAGTAIKRRPHSTHVTIK